MVKRLTQINTDFILFSHTFCCDNLSFYIKFIFNNRDYSAIENSVENQQKYIRPPAEGGGTYMFLLFFSHIFYTAKQLRIIVISELPESLK
jgi:hypothetical protein